MNLCFDQPLFLLLLPPALAAVYGLWRSSRTYMPPIRRRAVLGIRGALVALLLLASTGPAVRLPAEHLSVAFLLDRSDSILPTAQAAEEQWLARALASKGSQDQAAILTFGGTPTLERPLSVDALAPRLGARVSGDGSRTDIASAIRSGMATLPPTSARRIVLLSDGRENLESAASAGALAAVAGVQIDAVQLAKADGPEVLVRQLAAPTQARENEQFTVSAQIDSNVETSAALALLVDGRLAASQPVIIQPGANRFALPVAPLGLGNHELRLQVDPEIDTLPQNNAAGAMVRVIGSPRILLVEGTLGESRFLADALRAAELKADVATPGTASIDLTSLRTYDSVVLVNVPASALAPPQFAALKTYVQSFGGGLLVIGGDNAFGPGGYARTPLESMLPVRMDLRGQSLATSTALLMVIDTSGSMGEGPPGGTKIDLAKEAASAAAQLLGEYDKIGIIAFEDTPRWVVPLTPAMDLGIVESAIGQMQPGGGTDIYPALQMAQESLASVDAKVKHIILLTDGDAPRGDYPALAQKMRAANVTLSTIGVGSDANTALLKELAQLGNGRYYDGNDAFALPRLVVKETQHVQRAAIVEGEFQPIGVPSSPTLSGIDLSQMPSLRGYVATSLKPQGSPLLWSSQGDPLLAEWLFGLGHVVAWTSDARNRWATDWLTWPDFGRFWAQIVKRSTRPPQDPNRELHVALQGSDAVLTLDAQSGDISSERTYLNFLPTQATVIDPRGRQLRIPLAQVAPGQYQGRTPVADDGVYSVDVAQTNPDGSVVVTSSGFVVPYSPEFGLASPMATGTPTLLQSINQATGGRLLSTPADAFRHDLPGTGAPRSLWPPLLLLAALLFVLDIALRRLRLSMADTGKAYRAIRTRLGYQDEHPTRPPRATPASSAISTGGLVGPSAVLRVAEARPQHPAAVDGGRVTQSGRLLAAKKRVARRLS